MSSASGFYPTSSDPTELRRAVLEQARAQERNVATFTNHMALIKELDDNLQRASTTILNLTVQLARLETKMALYAGLGAVAGGALVSIATFAVQAMLTK